MGPGVMGPGAMGPRIYESMGANVTAELHSIYPLYAMDQSNTPVFIHLCPLRAPHKAGRGRTGTAADTGRAFAPNSPSPPPTTHRQT